MRGRMKTGTGTGVEKETREATETGTGTGLETEKGTVLEREGEKSSGIRHIRKYAYFLKIRHCHSAGGIISVDSRWRKQIASSFGRKTRRLSDEVVPRRKPA